MVEVKLELKFMADLTDPGEFSAVQSAFETLKMLGSGIPEAQKAPDKTKERAKPAVSKPKSEPEPEPGETAPEVTVDDVRAVMSEKVEKHRTTIKAELTRLGVPNVTTLPSDKYPEFIEFLKKLR